MNHIGGLFAAVLLCAGIVSGAEPQKTVPRRILSLAPSVTETLFALNLGERVVGVTDYCRYPPEAAALPKVGGYVTPNYEAVAALRPDLAVVLPEHEEVRPRLAALNVDILRVDDRGVSELLNSIRIIGERCGARAEAEAMTSELKAGLDRIARTIGNRPRPRVVLCLGGSGRGGIRDVHAVGPGGIHHDLIVYAGGVNAVPTGPAAYPVLSAEGFLRLDPDVIVQFVSGDPSPEKTRKEWESLSSLKAVSGGRVFVFTQDYLSIPGPRLVRFIETLARALHPEAPWKKN
ncbi:MAG: ABC transporter substrate-binding protein [Elusimicrobia bacterium]|nr:ABC transporter substrate-binding protein [Elusimicrobiota bacterium]